MVQNWAERMDVSKVGLTVDSTVDQKVDLMVESTVGRMGSHSVHLTVALWVEHKAELMDVYSENSMAEWTGDVMVEKTDYLMVARTDDLAYSMDVSKVGQLVAMMAAMMVE